MWIILFLVNGRMFCFFGFVFIVILNFMMLCRLFLNFVNWIVIVLVFSWWLILNISFGRRVFDIMFLLFLVLLYIMFFKVCSIIIKIRVILLNLFIICENKLLWYFIFLVFKIIKILVFCIVCKIY